MENHLKPAFGDAEIEIARGIREKREGSASSPTPWVEPDMSSYSKSSQTCCGGSEIRGIFMLNPPCRRVSVSLKKGSFLKSLSGF
jgi:hypothetical protein